MMVVGRRRGRRALMMVRGKRDFVAVGPRRSHAGEENEQTTGYGDQMFHGFLKACPTLRLNSSYETD